MIKLATVLLVLGTTSALAQVDCGPNGCVIGRPYHGDRYRDRDRDRDDRGYHRPRPHCAWVNGVRICR